MFHIIFKLCCKEAMTFLKKSDIEEIKKITCIISFRKYLSDLLKIKKQFLMASCSSKYKNGKKYIENQELTEKTI